MRRGELGLHSLEKGLLRGFQLLSSTPQEVVAEKMKPNFSQGRVVIGQEAAGRSCSRENSQLDTQKSFFPRRMVKD